MRTRDMLDSGLLDLGGGDHATFRDFAQNILCTGVTGGGKTSGPGRHTLGALMKGGCGGIILCAKPSEADEVRALCARMGRMGSLIEWHGRNGGFNFLAYALARLGPDGINGVVEYLMRVIEMVRNASPLRGGEGDAFWLDELKRVIRHTLLPVYLATGTLRIADILAFVRGAPTSPDEMGDADWQRRSFFFGTFSAVAERMSDADGERLMSYWKDDFARMDAKLRGNILAGFTMLDRFNHGWLANAVCGPTHIVPAMCFHGAIILLDMSRANLGEDGIIAQMLFKDAFQTEVLGRGALDPVFRERLVFCYADEAQEFVTSRDADFLAMSRSSRCSTIYLTQSLPTLYAKLSGPSAHDRAHHLVSNMGVRIFCANSCTTTNEWASRTIGKGVQRRANASENEGTNTSYGTSLGEGSSWNRNTNGMSWLGLGSGFGSGDPFNWDRAGSEGGGDNSGVNRGHGSNRGTSHGYSETMDDIVPAGFFASSLKTGGPAHGNRVSAIWVQAGRRFAASGGPSRLVEFAQ